MIKIQKASSSEVFDIYSKNLSKYLLKKNASWSNDIINELTAGGKTFFGGNFKDKARLLETLKAAGKSINDFIVELNNQGKSAEEISQLTGRNVNDIKKLFPDKYNQAVTEVVEQSIPNVSKIQSDVAQISKDVAEVTNAMEESSIAVKTNAKELIEITQNSKDLESKSLDEVIQLYEGLKRSRSSIKGQVTKLKSDLAKVKEYSQTVTEQLSKKDELIAAAEQLYKNTEQELIALKNKIQELGGQLDEAGNVIKGLKNELNTVQTELNINKQTLDLANQTIKELTEKGLKLTAENEKLLSDSLKASEMAGYYQSLYEASKKSGLENTPVSKAAINIATQAEKQSSKSIAPVVKQVPAAASIIENSKNISKENGVKKATKALEDEEKSIAETAKPNISPEKQRESLLQKLILKTSPYLLQSTGKLVLSGTSIMSTGILYLLKFTVIASLVGGAYLAWSYFFKKDPEAVVKNIKELIQEQSDLISKLRNLRFKPNSLNQEKITLLVNNLTKSLQNISLLADPEKLSEDKYLQILSDLDNLEENLDSILNSKLDILKELENPEEFNGIINNLNVLKSKILILKQQTLSAIQSNIEIPERGITQPIGMPAPEEQNKGQEQNKEQEKHIPQIIKVLDQDIDIGKDNSPGFRSVAPRIAEKLLTTPEGKAFLDPDNIWGGWLPKTTNTNAEGNVIQNKSVDYLRNLKFLYLNKIYDPHSLRKFIKDNLPKQGRKRLSGWNNAIKHYSGVMKNLINKKNNNNFTQNLSKSANYYNSSVISNGIKKMNKKADQISKEYYQGALTDLEDQYAKSYYTGLKGMYDQKPEHTDVDYKKMYQIHQESGADLIGESHPESITIADAMGNGGLVENQIEQQRHNIDVAKSMPSGNFRGKHAWILNNLIKLANQADEQGMREASDLIDLALDELIKIKK